MSLPTAPKTPEPLNRVQQTDYQSTPSNQNASATSQGLRTWTVPEIRPLLAKDVTAFNLGNLDRYLYHILRKVGAIKAHVVDGKEVARPSDEVILEGLQGCLEAIDKVAQKKGVLMEEIEDAFKAYSKGQTEAARYGDFVNGSNKVLALLKGVVIGGCRAAPSGRGEQLQFMVHDSREIQSTHGGSTYGRKPDVVLARRKFIKPLYPNDDDTKSLKHLMAKAPGGNFLPWEQGLMYSEFKKGPSSMPDPSPWTPVLGSESNGAYETKAQLEHEIAAARRALAEEAERATLPSSVASSSRPRRSQASRSRTVNNSRTKAHQPQSKSKLSVSSTPQEVGSSTSETGRKRSASAVNSQGPAQKKPRAQKETEADKVAAVQLGEYAAESLFNTFGREHVIGLLINGANINIWYYDHEAPLQMTGFDFLKNPQYFFLLLLALQRFSDEDWGFLPGFAKLVGNAEYKLDLTDCWISGKEEDSGSVEKKVSTKKGSKKHVLSGEKKNMKKPQFGLVGRATGVLYGVVGKQEVAVKLSYPEKARNREQEFIDQAKEKFGKRGYEDHNPCDYLPEILAAKEYTEFQSGPLRQAVLEKEEDYVGIERANRVPYLLAMPKYDPISSLTTDWEVFLGAFFALFYCHAMLWSIGIRHGDISESNLMWDPIEQKPKLCDFDLSHFAEPPTVGKEEEPVGPKGYSNTGTWIFMANELLTGHAMAGKVKRVYRHEVESFIAVLLWVTCQYKDGKLQKPARLDNWIQTNYRDILGEREDTYKEIREQSFTPPSSIPTSLWSMIRLTINRLSKFLHDLGGARDDYEYQQSLRLTDLDLGPDVSLDDYDGLRALRKIFAWPLFQHAHAQHFAKLLRERIAVIAPDDASVKPPAT
ncbi:hypothetical protein NMY22_g4228 [Coprinellus aureogranulatus]|nr:hypothetical protein NMY22_g4228 [Coprinellus aureogranulatus]